MSGNRQSGRRPYHPGEKLAYGRRLLGIQEVAERFDVSASTIRRWWAKGAIPRPLQAGGSGCALRWDAKQIEAFVAEQLGKLANEDEPIPSIS